MDAKPAGRIIVVVGPSGAGKDSLINHAAALYRDHPSVRFVRRVITRPADGATEDHATMTKEAFTAAAMAGGFVVSWEAHRLFYGIPAETQAFVRAGGIAVCNGSRSALPLFSAAFDHLTVVNVTARPEILAARLEARGRETRDDILRRLARSTMNVDGPFDVITIDNSGALEEAGARLAQVIGGCVKG
ncbi:phosphonate metabolism protein/1,5-bisphosphokinase (PRPP-forming) PhnN [Martelella endophytica]|uniref:Ribose 1,5-bisphosphate phosphokinase PhnN n=1 Tax=Martelella endophytica TaxID=1486262 RepID=A0A0D5LQ39_MAREN|nr:phosphonate metabolism protein/1,5-bisphosphokinase (PRPP-forming) PhnN [Martelella endophytica]AJY45438.1 ribose-phosphate pyrophosphokinase [Martelella endophytica]